MACFQESLNKDEETWPFSILSLSLSLCLIHSLCLCLSFSLTHTLSVSVSLSLSLSLSLKPALCLVSHSHFLLLASQLATLTLTLSFPTFGNVESVHGSRFVEVYLTFWLPKGYAIVAGYQRADVLAICVCVC